MDADLITRFEVMEKKVDAIYVSVEKSRRYFLWTLISSVVLFVLPLIALVVVIPLALDSYVNALSF